MKKNRSPSYYGASGCALGFIIMVCFVASITLAGPELVPMSGETYQTILNVGSWVLPLGLGVLGYVWAKNRQEKQAEETKEVDEAKQRYERASAYEEQNEFDKALKECDAVIQTAPGYADAHNLRGIALEGLGRKEEAISAYREAVRLDPTFNEAAENLQNLEAELISAAGG